MKGEESAQSSALGYYLYGILEQPPQAELPKGIDPTYPVHTLCHDGLYALVSQVALDEFDQEALQARMQDLEWVRFRVLAHEAVLEAAMASGTVLPMRFGILFRSVENLVMMLESCQEAFSANLKRLSDKQEWGVKAYCQERVLEQELMQRSERVGLLAEQISKSSPGAAYFLKRRMAEAVEQEKKALLEDYAQKSYERLCRISEAAHCEQPSPENEGLVLNAAFLVSQEHLPHFLQTLESLQWEYEEKGLLTYRLTGPWPPYHFVEEVSL